MKNFHVFGLGAIGSNLIIQLMKQYPDHGFFGYDFDTIEDRNIGPQAFFMEHIGAPKSMVIPTIASRFNRKIKYKPINKKVETPQLDIINDPNNIILDCFDNTQSRKLLCTGKAKNVLHIGFSPFYTAEIMWDKDYDVPGDVDPTKNDICEMGDATPFIHFIVNFAALTISKYINDEINDSYIITGKTGIKKL